MKANFDILYDGLVGFLKEKHRFAFRNRYHDRVEFFYGDSLNKLKKYSISKNSTEVKLPYKTISKIIKNMAKNNERFPVDDVQPGETDATIPSPTHFKYSVNWIKKDGTEQTTIIGAESIESASSIVTNYYSDFQSLVSVTKV